MHQQQRYRDADNVATAEHHSLFAFYGYTTASQSIRKHKQQQNTV